MKKHFPYFYKIGLVAAALSIFAFYIASLFTPDPTLFSKVFSFAVTPVFVGAGIYFYRFKLNGNQLSFAEGMTIGFLIYLINAFVTFLGIYIGLLLSPQTFDNIKRNMMQILDDKKEEIIRSMGQVSFDRTYEKMLALSIYDIAITDLIFKIAFGLFFTIIISIILRKNY